MMENQRMENRLSILPVPFEYLADLLCGRAVIHEGIPADAELVNVQQITLFRMVEFTLKSETFTPLKQGDMIPRLAPLLRRVEPTVEPLRAHSLQDLG
jgi:hypothetical protein